MRSRSSAVWLRTMCVRELFAGTVTVEPIDITRCGRRSRRAASGWNSREIVPGGSSPMISRVSNPSRSSASACASACSLTPPMYDHENGTTMPTFMSL